MDLPEKPTSQAEPVFSVKALVAGTLGSLCIAVGAPYGNMVIRGSYMSIDFSAAGALFLFFLLTGLFNALLTRFAAPVALGRCELIVAYIMMLTASTIPTMGLSEYWLTIITGAQYYATPENEWALLILPHLPEWIAPQEPEAIKWFYEGAPRTAGVPWAAWSGPLCYWAILIVALYLVMISSMVIMRRQWMERERLVYPLVQVPLAMVQSGGRGAALGPFFKNPIMWVGFALPVLVSSLNALHAYFNFIPAIQLVSSIPILRNTVSLIFRLSFPMIGFAYLINLDIAFSLWFFNTIAKLIRGGLGVLGVGSTEKLVYGAASEPILAHQGQGAMIVLVFFGLWVGREHLRDVLRKAFRGDGRIDDHGEMLSYRTAVLTWLAGVAVMTHLAVAVWLAAVGGLFDRDAGHPYLRRLDPSGSRGRRGRGGRADDCSDGLSFGCWLFDDWPGRHGRSRIHIRVGGRYPHVCHGFLRTRPQIGRGPRVAAAAAFLVHAAGDFR